MGKNDEAKSDQGLEGEKMWEEEASAILTDDDLELSLGLRSISSSPSSSSLSKNNVTNSTSDREKESRSTSTHLKIKPFVFKKIIKKVNMHSMMLFGVMIHSSTTVEEYLPVYNPVPLQSLPSLTTRDGNIVREPRHGDPNNVDTTLRLYTAPPPPPPRPLENFSRILRGIEIQLGGTKPVLLCAKRLTESDVSRNLNRLFITQSEKLMVFLNEEERRTVEDVDNKVWLEVDAIDTLGEFYRLHLSKWKSLRVIVINGSGWKKLICANGVARDDLIELWGFRQNSRFHLAVNFVRQLD